MRLWCDMDIKVHPFATCKLIRNMQLIPIVLDGELRLKASALDFEPLFASPFDHIRCLADKAGMTMEQVLEMARV